MLPLKVIPRCCLAALLLLFVGACGWMDLSALTQEAAIAANSAGQIAESVAQAAKTVAAAATSVAEITGPLQATSGSLLKTAAAGSQTEMPPALTSLARLMTEAAIQAGPVFKTSLFIEPHAGYQVVPGCAYASYDCSVKAAHTGIDSVDEASASSPGLPVDILAAGPGVVARIQFLRKGCSAGRGDCGLGNSVILEHTLPDGSRVYSLYAHMDTISAELGVGQCIPGGTQIGAMGASGFGARDGVESHHLHLEFKTAPVLGDPRTVLSSPVQFPEGQYFDYLMDGVDANPDHWGYRNPSSFINQLAARDCGQ